MSKTFDVKLDASGRICIPKEIRKALGLSAGGKLAIEVDVDADTITLRPDCEHARLVNKRGVLIHRWAVFDEALQEEFDEFDILRDEDGEVRAMRGDDGDVIDPEMDMLKWSDVLRDAQLRKRWKLGVTMNCAP